MIEKPYHRVTASLNIERSDKIAIFHGLRDRRRHFGDRNDRVGPSDTGEKTALESPRKRAMAKTKGQRASETSRWDDLRGGSALVRGTWHRQQGIQNQANPRLK